MLRFICSGGDASDEEKYCGSHIIVKATDEDTIQEKIDEITGESNFPREKFMCKFIKHTDEKDKKAQLDFINQLEPKYYKLFMEVFNKYDNGILDGYINIYEASEEIRDEIWNRSQSIIPTKIYEFGVVENANFYFCDNINE